MKRYLPLILLSLAALACKTLLPGPAPTATPLPPPTERPALTPTFVITSEPTLEPATPTVAASGLTLVELHPDEGDLTDLLSAEVQKAAAQGQIPVVEFDADW